MAWLPFAEHRSLDGMEIGGDINGQANRATVTVAVSYYSSKQNLLKTAAWFVVENASVEWAQLRRFYKVLQGPTRFEIQTLYLQLVYREFEVTSESATT